MSGTKILGIVEFLVAILSTTFGGGKSFPRYCSGLIIAPVTLISYSVRVLAVHSAQWYLLKSIKGRSAYAYNRLY